MPYEIVILERPTEKAMKDGAVERLVYGPSPVVAKNEQSAILHVMANGKPEFDINRAEGNRPPFRAGVADKREQTTQTEIAHPPNRTYANSLVQPWHGAESLTWRTVPTTTTNVYTGNALAGMLTAKGTA